MMIPTRVRIERILCDQIESTSIVAASQKVARERCLDDFTDTACVPGNSMSENTALITRTPQRFGLGSLRRKGREKQQRVAGRPSTCIGIFDESFPQKVLKLKDF